MGIRDNHETSTWKIYKKKMFCNKNDHRSGGAVKGVRPYLCIKQTIKLKKKRNKNDHR